MEEVAEKVEEQHLEKEATTAVVVLLEEQDAEYDLLGQEERQAAWINLVETHPDFETEIRMLKKTLDAADSRRRSGDPDTLDMIDHPFSSVNNPLARELLTSALMTRTGASTRSANELEVESNVRGDHPHIVDQDDLMAEAKVMADILKIRNGEQLAQINPTQVVRSIMSSALGLERSEPYQDRPRQQREGQPFTSIHSTREGIVGVDDHHHPSTRPAVNSKDHPSNN